MSEDNKRTWLGILNKYDVIWIEGNHDPNSAPSNIKNYLNYKWGHINFNHIATNTLEHEISGHYHPAVELKHKNQKIRRPCFIVSDNKIILPSYGAFTGGLNISDEAFEKLNLQRIEIYALGNNRVYKIA